MIFVPHVQIKPDTRKALDAAAMPWQGVYVGDDDAAYFDLLAHLWATGDDFAIVEHDIVPTPEALESFASCEADWCACPYPYLYGELAHGLGCTRFRSAPMERHPDLFDVIALMADAGHPPKHWCRIDAWMFRTLTARGETRCENHPQVRHLMSQRGSAHGCYVI